MRNKSIPKIVYSLIAINKILKENKASKVCVVTSSTLVKKLNWAIEEINIPKSNIILLPDGEQAKEWKELEMLLGKFNKLNLDRSSVVIALGGGVVGDITGFAASMYLRGIKYIQVPTTLLSQVDSAHGGKTGINFLGFKNQIGSTYMPIATIVDARFLETLGEERMVDGLGEIIKAGLIHDPSIISMLSRHSISTLRKSKDLGKVIGKAIKVKQYFVAKDLNDNEARQMLNFGHTIGHAIELKYKISHGRAVIIGMLQELKIAEKLKLSPASVRLNLENLLQNLGIEIDTKMKADWQMILHDKKISGDKIIFSVIEKEGKSKLINLDLNKLRKLI